MDDLEQQLTETTAAIYFGLAFAEYVKAVDPVMWQRAREFAIDHCQKVSNVRLTLVDRTEEDTDEV